MSERLEGRVVIVAGATRGAGRGVARGFGEAGATVYCTGRSVRGAPSAYGRPETIDETAELVCAAGGEGIAVPVDHGREEEVAALFERVESERGRLDVVVDSVAGEDPALPAFDSAWAVDVEGLGDVLARTVGTRVVTAKHAARALKRRSGGQIVEVTEGDTALAGATVVHGVVKAALAQLAFRLAWELGDHGVAAFAATPGFLRSETMLERFGVTEESWRDGAAKDPHFAESESPLFLGRALAALAADPSAIERSGELTSSWELARRYGVDDVDGRRPNWGRHFERIATGLPTFERGLAQLVRWCDAMGERGRRCLDAS